MKQLAFAFLVAKLVSPNLNCVVKGCTGFLNRKRVVQVDGASTGKRRLQTKDNRLPRYNHLSIY